MIKWICTLRAVFEAPFSYFLYFFQNWQTSKELFPNSVNLSLDGSHKYITRLSWAQISKFGGHLGTQLAKNENLYSTVNSNLPFVHDACKLHARWTHVARTMANDERSKIPLQYVSEIMVCSPCAISRAICIHRGRQFLKKSFSFPLFQPK